MSKINIHILEISQMDVFLNPQLWLKRMKRFCNPLLSSSMLISERLTQRETEFFATLQH